MTNPRWRTGKRLNPDYEKFVKSKPCSIKGCNGKVTAHHVFKRNESYGCIPLCDRHHLNLYPTGYHKLGYEGFENHHNVNIMWIIYEILSEYIHATK